MNIEEVFRQYTARFAGADGVLDELSELKLEHTVRVVADAELIMRAAGWTDAQCEEGCAAAWLHDIGRFEQLKRFGTFRDRDSVDHAALSVEVIEAEHILDAYAPDARARIIEAVRLHNRRELPEGLDIPTAVLAHLVRDADKLDIFRILDEQVESKVLLDNPSIFWDLPVHGCISPRVAESVLRGEPVEYGWIESLSDFILIQVGWVINGLHYPETRRLVRERGVVNARERVLKMLTDDPLIERCCNAARA